MPARLVWENHRSVTVHKFARVLCSHQYDFKNSTCLSVREDFTITMKRNRSFFTHKATSNFKNSQAVIGPTKLLGCSTPLGPRETRAPRSWLNIHVLEPSCPMIWHRQCSLKGSLLFCPSGWKRKTGSWALDGSFREKSVWWFGWGTGKRTVIWLGELGNGVKSKDVTSRFLAQMELPVLIAAKDEL